MGNVVLAVVAVEALAEARQLKMRTKRPQVARQGVHQRVQVPGLPQPPGQLHALGLVHAVTQAQDSVLAVPHAQGPVPEVRLLPLPGVGLGMRPEEIQEVSLLGATTVTEMEGSRRNMDKFRS